LQTFITVTLDIEVAQALEAHAEAQRIKRTIYIRRAVEDAVARDDAAKAKADAAKVLDDLKAAQREALKAKAQKAAPQEPSEAESLLESLEGFSDT